MSKKQKKGNSDKPSALPNQVIIVGEDDKAARERRVNFIREHFGCEVIGISDGSGLSDALTEFTEKGYKVKGILTDNTMEAVNGSFVIGSLRSGDYDFCYHGSAQIPVIMITGDVSKIINPPRNCKTYTKEKWYDLENKNKWGSEIGKEMTAWIEMDRAVPPTTTHEQEADPSVSPQQLGKSYTEAFAPGRHPDAGGYIADDSTYVRTL